MKVLYVGGQKSGKSRLAEQKALGMSEDKPYYVATYNNHFGDKEMQERLTQHQQRRQTQFITIEEPFLLEDVMREKGVYLVDCLSMWILNHLESVEEMERQLDVVLALDVDIVFVLNDVNAGVIPQTALSRSFVDLSGMVGQKVAAACDEVYEVVVGIEKRIK